MNSWRDIFPLNYLLSKKSKEADLFKKELDEVKHENHEHDMGQHNANHENKNHLSHHEDDYRIHMMNNSKHEKMSRGSQFINRIISWAKKDNWRRGREKKK